MLLRIIPLIMIISLLTVTMLTVVAITGNVVMHERALAYIPPAYQTALATFEQAFATGTYVAPTDSSVCISNDSPCSFYSAQNVTLPPQTAPQPTASCDAATNCAQNLQAHPVVSEGRIGARITVVISDSNHAPLVTRTRYITARTFSIAPYVAVIGERDGSIADRGTASEGANAGKPQQTAPDGSITQANTQITVKYHDATNTKPDVEKNNWSTEGWTNGNGSPTTWSP